MAKRNKKKKRRRQDGFLFPVPLAGLVVLVSTLALAYIWLGARCNALGKEIQTLEKKRDLLTRQGRTVEYRWVALKSPRGIEAALKRHRLNMSWPSGRQVVRMTRDDIWNAPWEFATGDDGRYAKLDRSPQHE